MYFVIKSGAKLRVTLDLFISSNEGSINLIMTVTIPHHGLEYLLSDPWRDHSQSWSSVTASLVSPEQQQSRLEPSPHILAPLVSLDSDH